MSTVLTAPRNRAGDSTPESSVYGAISTGGVIEKNGAEVTVAEDAPPLGAPNAEKRFWFQRAKSYDPDAVATLVGLLLLFLRIDIDFVSLAYTIIRKPRNNISLVQTGMYPNRRCGTPSNF
jgi:hypothetical protein